MPNETVTIPCSCCGTNQCGCKINTSDGVIINNFSYVGCFVWIHAPYPVPMTSTVWDSNLGIYKAPNAVIEFDADGKLTNFSPGDFHWYTRSGRGFWFPLITNVNGIEIQHWNGDSTIPMPEDVSVTLIQFTTDTYEGSCRLLARKRTSSSLDPNYYIWPTEENLPFEVIDSVPFNEPFLGNRVINLPYSFGGGVSGVELTFRCYDINTCLEGNFSIQSSGHASYADGSMISNEDPCTSHGSFIGTYKYSYNDYDPNNPGACNYYVDNKTTINKILAAFSCGSSYSWWNQNRSSVGNDFSFGFYTPYEPITTKCGVTIQSTVTDRDGKTTNTNDSYLNGTCSFSNDPFVLDIKSNNTITFKGIWINNKQNITELFNCEACNAGNLKNCGVNITPREEYVQGTVTITKI